MTNQEGIMQIDYSKYIDTRLYLTIGLISVGTSYSNTVRINISDYCLLVNWLQVEPNKEVEDMMAEMPSGRLNGLGFVLKGILKCSESYVGLHIDYYKYNTIKEYFNDYQLFKRLI